MLFERVSLGGVSPEPWSPLKIIAEGNILPSSQQIVRLIKDQEKARSHKMEDQDPQAESAEPAQKVRPLSEAGTLANFDSQGSVSPVKWN